MRKGNGALWQKLCVVIGVALLLTAAVTLVCWRWSISNSEKRAKSYVEALESLIPPPQNAVLEERRDNTMSVLSIDGKDFVGTIELLRYGSKLPVGADWGDPSKYPCRLGGSIYNGTLQVGATTQKGQYDFYRELSVGDEVDYIDVEGNRYSFEIKSMRYEKHIDQNELAQEGYPLVLFVKNIYSFEYLLVFCDVK